MEQPFSSADSDPSTLWDPSGRRDLVWLKPNFPRCKALEMVGSAVLLIGGILGLRRTVMPTLENRKWSDGSWQDLSKSGTRFWYASV